MRRKKKCVFGSLSNIDDFFCSSVCVFSEIFSCELNESKKEEAEMEGNKKDQNNKESQKEKEKEEKIPWVKKNWTENVFSLEEIEEIVCPGSLA